MAAPAENDVAEVGHEALTEALSAPTFCAAFQLTVSACAERPALSTPDGSLMLTWSEYAERVRRVAEGLASLGVRRGDCVGLLLSNRPEFHIVDNGAVHLGATPFSIYHTNPPEQIVPLLINSNARVAITERVFLERILAAKALHPALAHIIVVDADGDGLISLADLESWSAPGFDFDATWRALSPDEVVTLVYTSGTTGEPKGVQHTHATIMASCLSMHQYAPFTPHGRVVSYLPNAHIAERFISHYCSQVFGLAITDCADPRELAAAIARTRPTRLFGVPRIYEKLMAGVIAIAGAEPGGPLASAIDAGLDVVRAQQASETVDERRPDHAESLAGVRTRLGLDAAEWVGVAAAPSPYPMLEFFRAIGIDLVEFWGMSECIFSVAPPLENVKLGRIGIAAPGVEIRLAEDGEILVRGPNLMVGYRGEPEKTAEAIDAEGWLHSGDLAERDADGYLKIVDRKKELIINSAGKNMAPTKIEMAITQESPLIAQVVAIGDRRSHVAALIVLDEEVCAKDPAYDPAGGLAAFADSSAAQERIAAAVAAGNEHLARVEQVRRYTILKEPWAPGSDVLTPTQKLRRRAISERYASVIEAMYRTDTAS